MNPVMIFFQVGKVLLPIEFIWLLTGCFFICFIVLLVATIAIYINRAKKEQFRTMNLQSIRHHIVNFLFENNSLDSVYCLKKAIQEDKNNGEIIIEILLKIKKTLNDKALIRLDYLYNVLQLNIISAKKIYTDNWAVQILGIRELIAMGDTTYVNDIETLVNHEQPLLRIEALLAMIKLKGAEGLSFLSVLTYPISDWQQMQIIQILKEKNEPMPDFSKWFNSTNSSVVGFAIRLASIFQQEHLIYQIASFLWHQEIFLKIQAVDALRRLGAFSYLELIKSLINYEDRKLKLAILTFIAKQGTTKDLGFLKELLQSGILGENTELQLATLRAIKQIINNKNEFIKYANLYLSHHQEMVLYVLKEKK